MVEGVKGVVVKDGTGGFASVECFWRLREIRTQAAVAPQKEDLDNNAFGAIAEDGYL